MSEEPNRTHDVFLSYSTKDKTWADAACAVLERHRVRCWIAPRDITPGEEWGASIIKGLNASRIMVLIFSGHANASGQVRREVERAISQGMSVMPVRVEDVRPEGAMEFALGNTHWLDAFAPPVEHQLELLARSVKRLLGDDVESTAPHVPVKHAAVAPARSPERSRTTGDNPAKTKTIPRSAPKRDGLVEVRETRTPTETAPDVAPKRRPPWLWPSVVAGALILGLLAVWLSGVSSGKTPDGVIVLENVPKDAVVEVDGIRISVAPAVDEPLTIEEKAGKHGVVVKRGDLVLLGESVTLEPGKRLKLAVRHEVPAEPTPRQTSPSPPSAEKSPRSATALAEPRDRPLEPRAQGKAPEGQARGNEDPKPKTETASSRADFAPGSSSRAIERTARTEADKPPVSSAAEGEEIVLFNGKNLEGWTGPKALEAVMLRPELFVDRGEIHRPPNVGGIPRTVASFQNFVLKLEYRVPFGAVDVDSSISLHSEIESGRLLVQGVLISDAQTKGAIVYAVKPGATGDLCMAFPGGGKRIRPRQLDAENPVGQWNEIEIRSSGPSLIFLLNGRIVNQASANDSRPYHIGLGWFKGSDVHYRNIRLRPLPNADSETSRATKR